MIHLGTLDQQELSAVLHQIENSQKTGMIVINDGNIREEIYLYQGQVVTVTSVRSREPLVRRLVHADMISLNDLQKLPPNMGEMISQAQKFSQYSDVQIATILIKLGLIGQEQLVRWVKQETVEVLQQLLNSAGGEIYFEENVQPPTDCLYTLLTIDTPEYTFLSQPVSYNDGITEEERQNPINSTPILFKKSEPITNSKQFVPVTPSGSAQLPEVVRTAQDRIQRTVAAILPQHFADDGLTVEIAIPSTANPLFKWETLLIIAVLLIAGLAHGINMFHYPYYYDDEGTYMSQAWAVIHEGKLAPYTYIYDHAPLGWLQIALWTIITGGFHTFGTAIDSGRVFMLIIQISATFVLYQITRNISKSITIAVIVSLLFAFSPYGLYYQRRVLLDNICTFWMLISILLLVSNRLSLKKVWFSAIALSISILSKETTAFLIPALVYLVYYRVDKSHRWFAIIGWITLLLAIVSLYVLMAILKNELFPTGTLLGGNAPHVSLIGTVLYQASRGKDGGFFDIHSAFWSMAVKWAQDDPALVVGGSLSAIIAALVIRWHRLVGIMGLTTLSLWLFLGRGGEIIGFYLVPAIPLLALNIGLLIWLVVRKSDALGVKVALSQRIVSRSVQVFLVILCLIGLLLGYRSPNPGFQENHLALWNSSPTTGEQQAITWIKQHISPNKYILIDDFMWTDLHDTGSASDNYQFAYYYWKVERDPAIQGDVFHNDWHKVDYVITTIDMLYDANSNHMAIVENALNHSTLLAKFDTGWPIEILKVNK